MTVTEEQRVADRSNDSGAHGAIHQIYTKMPVDKLNQIK